MKKLMLSLGLSGLMFLGFAQEKGQVKSSEFSKDRRSHKKEFLLNKKSAEEIAQLRTDRLNEKLKFTDAQRKEIYALQLDQAKKNKERFSQRKTNQEQFKKDRLAQREKLISKLTPDQQKLYQELLAENRKQGRSRQGADRQMRRDRSNKDHNGGRKLDQKSIELPVTNG